MAGAQEKITNDMSQAAGPAGTAAGNVAGSKMTESISKKMGSAGGALTKGITAPLTAVGAASVAAWKEVDQGLDTIVTKTGASGEALDEMHGILNNIATSIPTDFETAGAAIGEVNTRFGVTGSELESLSEQFIKFAKLNDQDVSKSVDSVQKALSAFGMDASEATHMLDVLNAVGQSTGVSVDTLTSGLIQNATAFEEMGLSADQAVLFMGQMEKSGANSETVMQGLRKALKNAAKDGKDMNTALSELQDAILNGTDGMDGLTAAYDLFGKSGDQIYGAVKNGTIDFTNLSNAAIDAGGSVSDTFEGTLSPMERFQTTLNELKVIGADIVDSAGPALADIMERVGDGVEKAADAWTGLSPEMQDTIIKIAGIAAVAGPLLVIGGKVVGGISTLVGGIGSLAGGLGGLGSAAAGAAAPVATAGVSLEAVGAQAIQMIAAAAALYIAAQGISVLADAAIRVSEAGTPAIATLAGMAIGIGALMAVAAAVGPALTAGAVGIGVFGAAMLGIGAGVDLICDGVSRVTDAVGGLVTTVSDNSAEINSVVSNVGETTSGVITSVSDGITSIVDSISGGISDVLDSFAGIIDSMGESALNAGTGFEKLSGAVINLTNNTGVLDLASTLTAVATGVGKITKAAGEAGTGATKVNTLTIGLRRLASTGDSTGKAITSFGSSSRSAVSRVTAAFNAMHLASSMQREMSGAIGSAKAGIGELERMFSSTNFSFHQHIAVPHFTMSGSFNAETGSVPSISTNWYSKAESEPYLFDAKVLFGAGEKNDEFLYGRDALMRDIKEAAGGGGHTFYITVNNADNPEEFADRMVRELQLKLRTA